VQYEVSTEIAAVPEQVWTVLTDVEAMPEWTASMTCVQRLDDGPLAVGSAVRIKQPRLPTALWRVGELTTGRSFSWSSSGPGVTTEAGHTLAPGRQGGTTATFTIKQGGLLAAVAGLFTSALTRRYVDTELHGLKQRCEQSARP
jgi:uncharacterized membrane protein